MKEKRRERETKMNCAPSERPCSNEVETPFRQRQAVAAAASLQDS